MCYDHTVCCLSQSAIATPALLKLQQRKWISWTQTRDFFMTTSSGMQNAWLPPCPRSCVSSTLSTLGEYLCPFSQPKTWGKPTDQTVMSELLLVLLNTAKSYIIIVILNVFMLIILIYVNYTTILFKLWHIPYALIHIIIHSPLPPIYHWTYY